MVCARYADRTRRKLSPMSFADDPADLEKVRLLLTPPASPARAWPMLAAAAAFAISSLLFAAAMVLAPPVTSEPLTAHHRMP